MRLLTRQVVNLHCEENRQVRVCWRPQEGLQVQLLPKFAALSSWREVCASLPPTLFAVVHSCYARWRCVCSHVRAPKFRAREARRRHHTLPFGACLSVWLPPHRYRQFSTRTSMWRTAGMPVSAKLNNRSGKWHLWMKYRCTHRARARMHASVHVYGCCSHMICATIGLGYDWVARARTLQPAAC